MQYKVLYFNIYLTFDQNEKLKKLNFNLLTQCILNKKNRILNRFIKQLLNFN